MQPNYRENVFPFEAHPASLGPYKQLSLVFRNVVWFGLCSCVEFFVLFCFWFWVLFSTALPSTCGNHSHLTSMCRHVDLTCINPQGCRPHPECHPDADGSCGCQSLPGSMADDLLLGSLGFGTHMLLLWTPKPKTSVQTQSFNFNVLSSLLFWAPCMFSTLGMLRLYSVLLYRYNCYWMLQALSITKLARCVSTCP